MRNTVASLIMLTAGMVAVLCCILMGYTLENTLIVLTTVLFVFMIIGFIAQKIIMNMTKEAEERLKREEEKRREEEARALAAMEEASLEATEIMSETQHGEVGYIYDDTSEKDGYLSEPVN